jgi:PleD family two-component response regulator
MAFLAEIEGPRRSPFPNIIKTLLLDDSSFDRARIRRMSGHTNLEVDLTEVSSISQLREAVALRSFDLILIDYRLPEGDGLEVLSHIHQSDLNNDVATIMISGEGDMQVAVTAMRKGCHDFLTKDIMTADQLGFAMRGAIGSAQSGRDLAAQTMHLQEIVGRGFAAALMDENLRDNIATIFKEQITASLGQSLSAAQDHSSLETLLATLSDDDEFIFN